MLTVAIGNECILEEELSYLTEGRYPLNKYRG